ncbi:unnamed protein product [Phytophthora fragariaefolia]|uniref:Unnamed protein product n=1 Tax=Phytophthora fragariaefolia TaxID=1490495 RepID=A0A9W6YH85_9STRA|nr:unnamed protein product [Phytophthora fragariaefolia]
MSEAWHVTSKSLAQVHSLSEVNSWSQFSYCRGILYNIHSAYSELNTSRWDPQHVLSTCVLEYHLHYPIHCPRHTPLPLRSPKMPASRLAKSMSEKKEVVSWIEQHGESPARTATDFENEKGGAGAKPRLAEVEDLIFDYVLFLRSDKKVSRSLIAEMGKGLAQSELHDHSFVGSNKSVVGFMQRYNLSLRRTTNLTTLTDDVLTDRAVHYMEYLSPRLDALSLDHTVHMDETAVYFEDPRRKTIDATCAHHCVVKSTGFASMRVTAVLAVSASGRKLPPLVVWKGALQEGVVACVGVAGLYIQANSTLVQHALMDTFRWATCSVVTIHSRISVAFCQFLLLAESNR